MDSRKALFALLAGAALTTVIGILLTTNNGSSKRKKIVEKVGDYSDTAEETLKNSVTNVKTQLKKWLKMPTE